MDDTRFDALTRSFAAGVSRRTILGGVLATVGLGALSPTVDAARKKKKKKKLQLNAFGCVDVGKPCRGKDSKCCSDICQGKKPKKGKKDRSECVGHDESTCLRGQHLAECGGVANVDCLTSAGLPGRCSTTTGNAGYCLTDGDCFPCKRDADCQAVAGPRAACIPCAAECVATGGTACVNVDYSWFSSARLHRFRR
jgi:hypothetical protein